MKKDWKHLERYRLADPPSPPREHYGAFSILFNGKRLNVIATDGVDPAEVWEHVSCYCYDPVFRKQQTPTWEQMAHIASLFWEDDECLVQYRPAKPDYVNVHEHVLHWWKPTHIFFPTPPKDCV